MGLSEKSCVPCRGGVPPLPAEEVARLVVELDGWRVVDQHHLTKNFVFPDFAQGLEYVNRVGALADGEGHHPDLFLTWGKVRIDIYTHAIDGLTESDFILAAKIDQLSRP